MPEYFDFPINRPALGEFEKGARFLIAGDFIGLFQPVERWKLLEEIYPTLCHPCAVFPDLKRPGFEDAIAYSRSIGDSRHVCLVFADYRKVVDALVVFDCEPRLEDSWRKGLPDNFKNDFGDPLWMKPEA